ncbi:MAG TPA: SRPBCC family protein, partial [Dehalococcoidia bacterium]|nr:SRPBCC family protein [Dehalococcoidia bacterium]
MTSVDKKIQVELPVQTVYNQWTQFEEYPEFMEGVQSVEQTANERLHWSAEVGGVAREWDALITRQVPDQVIAWESEGGAGVDGTVVFHPLDRDRTEIELHMGYEAEGLKEQVGGALGFLSRKVDSDLKRFKDYVEHRGIESGAWRGEIAHGRSDAASQLTLGNTVDDRETLSAEEARRKNDATLPGSSTASNLRDDFGASKHETGMPEAETNERYRRGLDEAREP